MIRLVEEPAWMVECDEPGCNARLANPLGGMRFHSMGAMYAAAHRAGWLFQPVPGGTRLAGRSLERAWCPRHRAAHEPK